jgi:glycosyltransferase involved in cell wall biosynthesis
MKITVCLVTKGRSEYLRDCLSSLEEAIQIPEVLVFIVSNGCDQESLEQLRVWSGRFPEKVNLVELQKNNVRPDLIFPIISKTNPDWVIFPGDDDKLIAETLKLAISKIKSDRELVAIGYSARIINEKGNETGETINPSGLYSKNQTQTLGRSFSEPPAIWPSLLFKYDAIKEIIPTSRFAFDWWVSVNLLLVGKVEFSSEYSTYYRRHSGQESSVVPPQRKYLEDYIWLRTALESNSFKAFVERTSNDQLAEMWLETIRRGPIYDDPYLGRQLLIDLGLTLSKLAKSDDSRARYLSQIAKLHQVILFGNEVRHLGLFTKEFDDADIRNFNFAIAKEVCGVVSAVLARISDTSLEVSAIIGCAHSPKGDVRIDCVKLSYLPEDEKIAWIIMEISKNLLQREDINSNLSIGEKILLSRFRAIRKKMPGKLRNKLRKLRG